MDTMYIKHMEWKVFHDWITRIYYANICMDNDKVADVVKEIASALHVSEGDKYEDKIQERYYKLMEGDPERPQARA
jgi:hypothetical protein